MSGAKPTPTATLFFLVILIIHMPSLPLTYCIPENHKSTTSILCPQIEKEALLSFKQSLEDPLGQLSSWINGTDHVDCCNWKGVVCNNVTGHIHELHLRGHSGYVYDQDSYILGYASSGLRGKINPFLLNLKQLRYLDLSKNDFGETIPSFIGSFTSMEYLNLSCAGFHGTIPHAIGNLSNLRNLGLAASYYQELQLDADNLKWLSGLSQLEHLNLNNVNLSKAAEDWLQVINTLPSLAELHFQNCSLTFIDPLIIGGNISSSLRYLDLSYNSFNGTIPSFVGSFTSLEYLDLSQAGFLGTIPHTVGNLSNLHTLSLGEVNFPRQQLDVDNLEWLSGLSQLEYLNMNGANLSKAATNWVQVVSTLPHLAVLSFRYCGLNFFGDPPINDVNISSSLTALDLSLNKFQSFVFLRWIFQLKNLISLDLKYNHFEGPIPSTINTTRLQHIDLSYNRFNSTIPDWLYFCKDLRFVSLWDNSLHGTISSAIANLSSLNSLDLSRNKLSGEIPREIVKLCKMRSLDLPGNKLQGEISDSFGNMSDCFLGALEFLSLNHNQLSGHLTHQFGEFKHLQTLDLSSNLLSGAIPVNLGNTLSLKWIDLSDNKLTGNLIESLGQLSNLQSLSIDDNKVEGVVTESHFANLTNLRYLSASGNRLTLKVNPKWIPPFKLEKLGLGSWDLGMDTKIPSWLNTQKNTIETLDLSNTGISGHVPDWFWGIGDLNLSHNHLYGKIPDRINNTSVDLSSNQFSGSLPRFINSYLESLYLSNNSFSGGLSHLLCNNITNASSYKLKILHLEGNQLTGELPNCWMKWPSLKCLNLGNNNLSGSIPNSIGFLVNLWSLNLHNNRFSGQIPFSLCNCTYLGKIDFADNSLEGNLPTWVGSSLPSLRILILRSNKLTGNISSDICHLNHLRILDLSKNKISGMIPKCVNNFSEMARKISYDEDTIWMWMGQIQEGASVITKGRELYYDTILHMVTNIDLAENNLSGYIPNELTSLVELRSLNLSGNQLTGVIPFNIGDMKQLESLDFSRNSLFGEIPNSITTMSSLNYLNLSYNNFRGRIPESTQIRSFDPSSFIGNQLCGPPLTSNCSNDNEVSEQVNQKDREGDKSEIEWVYVFMSLGFALGFSVVCSTLILNKSWRDAYFGLLEDTWNKLYVFFYIRWTRLTKRRSS